MLEWIGWDRSDVYTHIDPNPQLIEKRSTFGMHQSRWRKTHKIVVDNLVIYRRIWLCLPIKLQQCCSQINGQSKVASSVNTKLTRRSHVIFIREYKWNDKNTEKKVNHKTFMTGKHRDNSIQFLTSLCFDKTIAHCYSLKKGSIVKLCQFLLPSNTMTSNSHEFDFELPIDQFSECDRKTCVATM